MLRVRLLLLLLLLRPYFPGSCYLCFGLDCSKQSGPECLSSLCTACSQHTTISKRTDPSQSVLTHFVTYYIVLGLPQHFVRNKSYCTYLTFLNKMLEIVKKNIFWQRVWFNLEIFYQILQNLTRTWIIYLGECFTYFTRLFEEIDYSFNV